MKTLMIRGERLLTALRWFDFVRDRLYTGNPVERNPHGFAEGPRLAALLERVPLVNFLTDPKVTAVREMLARTLEAAGNRKLLSIEIDVAPMFEKFDDASRGFEPGFRFLRQFAAGEISEADLMPGA